MSDTETPMSPAPEDTSEARKTLFSRLPMFWQNVAASIVASVIVAMAVAIPAVIFDIATGDAAGTLVAALLGFATAGSLVIAIAALVQLIRSGEKYKWLILTFLWAVVAMLGWFTLVAFSNR